MVVNDCICETLSVLICTVVLETASSQRQCSQFYEISLLCGEVAQWSCCHSSCLWCISFINYLHKTRTISSPIMHRFSIDCQRSFLPWSNKFHPTLPFTPCFFSPQVPVQSWFDDMTDTELLDLIPLFEGLSKEEDVYSLLQSLRNR